ncbi:hypothetical protein A3C23_00935 [Candidatus Roizmanbacteria bacterium RIFCSPHIGHO2_02_FULL_37_13b]|uniref:Glycosyltransferase RgtA/B/C/D-like domain-containing protein n=1 Tax=Candidatus Roizmanbacteria bacterium RIFCSPLOWO2_02_FULL_36_11 TaxID=1802071 RepID=A0A1F7JIX2_9BACT|nr:MAG: hypothetical protein A3C23_00935 [Candidatus Roizmanbacteria bacterium RIFCSPHIGHO2_02_FULL_37_13b]OGK55540.1 MAG: hypothetical protein A3H78_05250 [Candidatus Roizmanbacteria bacterium RIFCSPLOWO2_02_FULL_36_11]
MFKKYTPIILILLLALMLRVIALNQSFWLDETIQATVSNSNSSSINWSNDFQPPLFYLFSHLWQQIGINYEWFLRLPSVIFGILTVFILYLLIKDIAGKHTAILSALFLATAPFHIYYSQEYRMYSFFTLLVALSWYLLYKRKLLSYFLTLVLLSYTHYFTTLVIISQIIYVILARQITIKRLIVVFVATFFFFIPWLPTLFKQIQTASNLISIWPKWQQVAGVTFLKFPFLLLAKFTVGMISPTNKYIYGVFVLFMAIIFFLYGFKLIYQYIQPRRLRMLLAEPKVSILLIPFVIPLILAWISSVWISASSPHRLLFTLPFFYGILAVGFFQENKNVFLNIFKQKKLKMIFISILVLCNLVFSFLYLLNPKNHREAWREAIAYTDNKIGDRGVALSEFIDPWAPMIWYSKYPEKYLGASNSMKVTNESIQTKLDSRIQNTQNLILYTYLYELSDPNRLVEKYLATNGFKLTEEKDFRGVGIIKIYKND